MYHAVILAGGGGTRLWPASRKAHPKQFLPLGVRPGESLLAATVRRLSTLCSDRLLVVTSAEQQLQAQRAIPHLPPGRVLAEPAARNTAAAIGLAAVYLLAEDEDAVMAVIPSDHVVKDDAEYARVATIALRTAEREDAIVTIGVVPTRAETGFGYLELGAARGEGVREVMHFFEKPDAGRAAVYLASGNHVWNAGMFFVRARRMLEEIACHLPDTGAALRQIAEALRTGGQKAAEHAAATQYPALQSISIDYGVMEKSAGILCVPGDFGWNDVGSWGAIADYRGADTHGNVSVGTVVAVDAKDNICACEDGMLVALVGVDNLVVVQAGDAILVIPRDRAQDVREVVRALQERHLDRFL
jgi:mannose-1-phosphate guanylyltransferase